MQAGGSLNLNVNLTNWFNIYDSWNVWLTYGVGDPMPAISTDLFNQVRHWIPRSGLVCCLGLEFLTSGSGIRVGRSVKAGTSSVA